MLFGLACDFFAAWIAMLGLGAAHASDSRIPTLGYGAMFWLTFGATAIVGAGFATSTFSKEIQDL